MHRLAKEHSKTREEFESTKGKYEKDLDEMIREMEKMQVQILEIILILYQSELYVTIRKFRKT